MKSLSSTIALAALLLTSCTTPYKTPVISAKDGGTTAFSGIADMLSKERPLDVLLVHGMCTQDATWATKAVQQVVSEMGGDPSNVNLTQASVDGSQILLYQQTFESPRGALRANAILWSPLTTHLKGQLCYDETDKSKTCDSVAPDPAYPYARVTLNRLMKDTILDDCLADALIYQGKSRDEMNRQMQKAVLQAVGTSGGKTAPSDIVAEVAAVPQSVPLVFVTESLGSKIAFDAVYQLAIDKNTESAGKGIFNRTTEIFMGANQLPILALADKMLDGSLGLLGASKYPDDPIAALTQMRAVGVAAAKLPLVVAFTDPNDLLSFILAPRPHAAEARYPVVDVIVSNADSYLGFVEMPTTAHEGYLVNDSVRRLITCGNPTSAFCK